MLRARLPDDANPIDLFQEWMNDAVAKEGKEDATAMSLATIGEDGLPDVRMVLLKGISGATSGDTARTAADAGRETATERGKEAGFIFYTNLQSTKGRQLARNPVAALCFHWKSLERQVRVRGSVEPVSPDEADAYFNSRARESRIGAWASEQSRPLDDSLALEKRVALFTARYAVGSIPRPPHWSGFRLVAQSIEFWIARPFRLHERLRFDREGSGWKTVRLFP